MATVKIKNTTSSARTGVVTMGVPFGRGEGIQPTDTFIVSGAYTNNNTSQKVQWEPVGVRWDDGSVKYARMTFKTDLTATQEKTVSITKTLAANATADPFIFNSGLQVNLTGTVVQFQINGINFTVPMSTLLSSTNRIAGGGTNDYYARYRYFTHLPNNVDPKVKYLWVDFVAEVFSGLNYVQFYFRYGYYRFYPQITNHTGVDPVFNLTQSPTLHIIGPRTAIRYEDYVIPSVQTLSTTDKIFNLVNMSQPRANLIPMGGSRCLKGVMVFETSATATAELEEQILAMSTDWKYNYPITGVMPPRPSYIASDAEYLTRSNTLLNTLKGQSSGLRTPFNWPGIFNLADIPRAGIHGYRDYAYGLKGMAIFGPDNYNWIPYLEWATRQASLWPNWYLTDSGNPIPPQVFYNATCRIWGGTYYQSNELSYAGFTSGVAEWHTNYSQGSSYYAFLGPDKEHWTTTMIALQAFITMDWFGSMWMEHYTKHWIYANRTDQVPWWQPTAADYWGTSRAVGRGSQNAAFFYEFTADTELKYWIDNRWAFNYLIHFWGLNQTNNPGSPLTYARCANVQDPSVQGSGLNEKVHWRPWEEGQACFGLYLLAKAVLNSDPTDTVALQTLSFARDIAASVLVNGFVDYRSGTGRQRLELGVYNEAFVQSAIHGNQIGVGVTAVGLTSGATGTIFLYGDGTDGRDSFGVNLIRLEMNNCNGVFQSGETIRLSTGVTYTVFYVYRFVGLKSHDINTSLGYGRSMTQADKFAIGPQDGNYPLRNAPVGNFVHYRTYEPYGLNVTACLPIVKEAALLNYYSDSNSTLLSTAIDYFDTFDTDYSTDNGDINESFVQFAGYLITDTVVTLPRTVYVSPTRSYTAIPDVTTVLENTQVNASVTPTNTSGILFTITSPTVVSTTSIDVTINPTTSRVNFYTNSNASRIAGITITPSAEPRIDIYSSSVDSVYTQSFIAGKRKFTYIFMGDPDTSPSRLYTDPDPEIETNIPFPTEYEKFGISSSLVTPLNSSVTEYVYTVPKYPASPLLGERLPSSGQTLRAQGYTFYIGSEVDDLLDETSYTIASSTLTHTIYQSTKGAHITRWKTTVNDSGEEFEWLRRYDTNGGIKLDELLDLNILENNRKIFNPNYGGAISPSDNTYKSPPRLMRSSTISGGKTLIEGAVTPLDYDSFGRIGGRPQDKGGSLTNPALVDHYKQYFALGVDVGGDGVCQLDFWSFHPKGTFLGISNISSAITLNLVNMFKDVSFYNPSINYDFDITPYLGTRQSTYEASTALSRISGTYNDPTAGTFSSTLASPFPGGYGSIIATHSSGFSIGIASRLYSDPDSCRKPNVLRFVNHVVPTSYNAVDSDSGKKLVLTSTSASPFISDGDETRRADGWIGLRMYIIIKPTKNEVKSQILDMIDTGVLDALPGTEGLFIYERPAII